MHNQYVYILDYIYISIYIFIYLWDTGLGFGSRGSARICAATLSGAAADPPAYASIMLWIRGARPAKAAKVASFTWV